MDAASDFVRDRERSPSALGATLAAIVECSDDAIFTTDLDGIITTWNAGAERMFGYPAAEVVGQPATMLMPADRLTEESDVLERIRRGGRVEPYETIRRRKDGTLLDTSLTVSPIRDAGGPVVGASEIARDITGRKRVFALIACQKEALEMAAMGAPLMQTLGFLAREIETQSRDGAVVAIHALDETGTCFVNTAAPGLPQGYAEAVDGMEVRSAAGPCCAAVSSRQRIVVADVAASHEFAAFAAFALPLGICAGWSAPIFSSSSAVLGTIATYYRADSAGVGHGATFIASLPMRAVAGPLVRAASTAKRSDAPRLPGTRVLVVDDEADARELMRYVLEASGAQVSVADTAAEALQLLGRDGFDVLVADLGMPAQDGYGLIRAVRRLPEARANRLPAIAVTAYAGLRDREMAAEAGYQCHLPKPVNPEQLVDAVAAATR